MFSCPHDFRVSGLSASRAELEWKIVYVGSAEDEKHDQTLDSVLVGPVQLGCNKFVFQVRYKFHCNLSRLYVLALSHSFHTRMRSIVSISRFVCAILHPPIPTQLGESFQAEAPNPALIPDENLLDVTVVLLLGLYKDQEFIRVGYYVNNELRTNWRLALMLLPSFSHSDFVVWISIFSIIIWTRGLDFHSHCAICACDPILARRPIFAAGVTPEQIEAKTVNARAQLSQIQRVILANQPRVTRHEIPWDDEQHQARLLQEHQEAEAAQVSYRRRGSHLIMSGG